MATNQATGQRKATTSWRISDRTKQRLRELADKLEIRMTPVVEQAIRELHERVFKHKE